MNIFWVLAHPDNRSLNAALHREAVALLTESGHHVEVSDLYAMKWNPVVDRADFGTDGERLYVPSESKRALLEGTLSADITAEQDKLRRADLVVVQFPLWWYGVPAILKGWIDRVFVKGFAYGLPDPGRPGHSLRYGAGELAGKRALAVVTVGGPESGMSPRGINGSLTEVLWPLLHGTFFYTGMCVLPPVAVYNSDRLGDDGYAEGRDRVLAAVSAAETADEIPYRAEGGGDYADDLVLHPEIEPGRTGLAVHRYRP